MSLQTRLAPLIAAVGADIKQLRADIAAVPSGSGGSDPWTHQALTTARTNSTVTGADIFTGFAPAANTRYIVDALLSVITQAGTTGVQTALLAPTTGITRAAVKIVSSSSTTADKIDNLALNAYQGATAGIATLSSLISIQAIIDVGATPGAGNVRAAFRSEVAGSTVTINPGSSMRWRTI